MWLLSFCLVLMRLFIACAKDVVVINVTVNTKHEVGKVDKMFIGVTLDSSEFGAHWKKLNFTYVEIFLCWDTKSVEH
jgi:hypothetical protein